MRAGRRGITLMAAVLTLTGCASTLPAQEAREAEEAARRSCRCVDRAGEEIESCVCVVTPDVSRIVATTMGSLRRARLGVGFDWTQEGDEDRQGVRIESVAEGSPAEEAGLREGDILVTVAGRHLLNPLPDEEREQALDEDASLPVQRLLAATAELEPGEAVEVRYLRDGQERTATVVPEENAFGSLRIMGDSLRARIWRDRGLQEEEVRLRREMAREHEARARVLAREHEVHARELAERMRRDAVRLRAEGERMRTLEERLQRQGEAARELALRFEGPGGAVVAPRRASGFWWTDMTHGVALVELNADLADYFDVDRGVLVTEVAEESDLGLRPGDVILAIGDREVEDVGDVRRILRSFEDGEEILFRVVRRGDERTVTGRR